MPKRPLYARCRALVIGLALAAAVVCASADAFAQAPQPPCAACVVFVVDPVLARALASPLHGLEILVHPAHADAGALHESMEAVRRAGGRPGLFLPGSLVAAVDVRTLAAASRIVVDLTGESMGDAELAVFHARRVLSELRGAAPEAAVGVASSAASLGELLGRGLGPYLDFAVTAGGELPAGAFLLAGGVRPIGLVAPVEPSASLPGGVPGRWLVAPPADTPGARRIVDDVARAAPFLGDRLIEGGIADVRCGERRQPTYLDAASLDTIAVVRECAASDLVVDPDAGGVEQAVLSSGAILVRIPASEGVFTEGVQVLGERTLSAREVVARHQAAAARQRRQVRTLVSSGSMTLTFEAPGFPAPMTITSETVIFAAPDRVEMEQRDIRVNGIAFRAEGVPRLPLIEPERVASPPLDITLSEVYRYAIAGQEDVAGVPCYVVTFEPLDRTASLFAGRAWIARDSFALVRVAAVQTGLQGPIVSSEQIDEFRREADAAWLLARSEVRQLYEGAGHRTPIHRVLTVRQHEINSPAFDERRRAAYASRSVMLRDTAEGFRYLRRDPGAAPDSLPEVAAAAASVRTVALGAVFDPNINRPLPFAGISYVHFDLFGRGGQFNGFFGGTYGQLALSLPSIAGTRWQVGARAFGIASAYNDRAFVEGREVYRANIAQRPAHASVWLLRPVSDRATVRAGYAVDYTHFGPSGSTAPSFTVPAAQLAHGLSVAVQGQWAGLDASAWWTGSVRTGWREWGEAVDQSRSLGLESYDPRHRTYQRHRVTVGRSWIASPRLVGRLEAAWMDGRDLDRFSRYTFGTFESRLRGYPAALIRYDRGAVVRAATAWAAGRALRIDGFVDTAFVRDPGFGGGAKRYTGVGMAAEVPGPFGTLLGVEWGYGFQGINTDGSRGTQVVRVSGYKMF